MEINEIITDWFDKYCDDIYQFIVYRVGFSDAEDLTQEVFIRAIRSYDSFKGETSPKSWLLSIARNIAIDELRKRNRNKWKSAFLSITPSKEPTNKETPDYVLFKSEFNKELYDAIQLLKPQYRDVIVLKGLKELSVTETADVLGWKENKVRLTYHRAKKALKAELGGNLKDE